MTDLAGKTAIVTGGGRGLGRAYALRLAGLGAAVAVVDRSLTSYDEFAAERSTMTAATSVEEIAALGVGARGFEADVSDAAALEAVAAEVQREFGSIDIVVANAGGGSLTADETKPSDIDLGEFDAVVRRNLYGTVNTVHAVAPFMKQQGSGRIITVSSTGGLAASLGGGYSHYGTAKAAITMYTRFLAQDLGPYGINCNCIAPGLIGTARILANVASSVDVSTIPLGRPGTVEEVADLIEFLASDRSRYINGALITIDGGMTRGPA